MMFFLTIFQPLAIISKVDKMDYVVTIDKFEGPLDLLLHLIKQADIDILDIKISEITSQYLSYISKMENMNLNIDSEYITMAADLIEMKSRELLPRNIDEEEEDPKEELINRLLEYKKYKEISSSFKDLEEERKQLFTKNPTFIDDFKTEGLNIADDITLDMLIEAFAKFREKKSFEKPLNTVVTRKEYSVHKRSQEILNRLQKNKKIVFEELFDIYTKDYVVVTFLSILDLAKKGTLEIKQDRNLDQIVLLAKE